MTVVGVERIHPRICCSVGHGGSPPALVRGYSFARGEIRAAKEVLPRLRCELRWDNRSLHGLVINTAYGSPTPEKKVRVDLERIIDYPEKVATASIWDISSPPRTTRYWRSSERNGATAGGGLVGASLCRLRGVFRRNRNNLDWSIRRGERYILDMAGNKWGRTYCLATGRPRGRESKHSLHRCGSPGSRNTVPTVVLPCQGTDPDHRERYEESLLLGWTKLFVQALHTKSASSSAMRQRLKSTWSGWSSRLQALASGVPLFSHNFNVWSSFSQDSVPLSAVVRTVLTGRE